jgi:hypothetical protein
MNVVTDSTGLIVMASANASPIPPAGGQVITLTPQQTTAYAALVVQPNGGITFDGSTFAALPFVPPVIPDPSDANNLPQALKAVLIASAILAGKPQPAVAGRAAFLTAWQSLS